MLVYCGVRLSTKITECKSESVSLSLLSFFSPLRVLWRETAISHVCVILTMLFLVALGIVFSSTVVTTERAEKTSHKPAAPPLNYSRISLPAEHIPYFLYNNKRVAKQCRLDPLCPFKVRYALCQLFSVQIFFQCAKFVWSFTCVDLVWGKALLVHKTKPFVPKVLI